MKGKTLVLDDYPLRGILTSNDRQLIVSLKSG
jgi:hypothetical protein